MLYLKDEYLKELNGGDILIKISTPSGHVLDTFLGSSDFTRRQEAIYLAALKDALHGLDVKEAVV